MVAEPWPVALIDKSGHLTVRAKSSPADSRLILGFNRETTSVLAFLFRARNASIDLRIVSMEPIDEGNTEVILSLPSPERATRFLDQLKLAFPTAGEQVATTLTFT